LSTGVFHVHFGSSQKAFFVLLFTPSAPAGTFQDSEAAMTAPVFAPLATLVACGLAAAAAQAQETRYRIDPSHTTVSFEARHFGASTQRGRFDREEGAVVIDPAARTGKVEIHIDMASVSTGVAAFDAHLKGPEVFNVEHFPRARFVGDRVVFSGDRVASVSGTLVMLGRSVPVTLTASGYGCYAHPVLQRQVCGGDFEGTLQLSAWGLRVGLPALASDSVRLRIQVEAIRQ
jgi:polyisoprenoid-binding protein YceI